MWKATIRGLFARKVRLALTAMAILLGVAFVSATYVLTDSVKRSFESVFAQTLTGVDLRVGGASALNSSSSAGRISESVTDQVAAVAGVRTAQGFVQTSLAQFVDRDGDPIGGGGPPTFGISWIDDGPLRLTAGRAPDGPGQLAMDAGTAAKQGFRVGDRVRVLLSGAAKEYEIVGLFGFGSTTDFGAVTFAAFDLPTAQREFSAGDSIDAVYVQREPDVTVPELQARLERALGPGYQVQTAAEATLEVGKPVRQFLGFFTDALLGFAAIGVVVGAFIIFNTFTILVAQRTRELGLLRAMGATGGQVVRSVVLEALMVGAVASAAGLAVGIVLGSGLLELLRELGLDLPATTTIVLARTVVVSLLVGVVVTVVAAAIPAVRAARVPPVAAIADVPERVVGGFGRRIVIGAVVLVAGAALLAYGLARARDVSGIIDEVQVVAFGAFGVLVGVVLLLPAVVRPAVRVIGRPLRGFGPPGRLARANAMRNPRRTAITASALVIGLALVGLTATFGASARASVGESTGAGLRADYVVKTEGFASFSTQVAERLRDLPEVTTAASMRIADVAIDNDIEQVGGIDPASLTRVVDLDVVHGDAGALDDDGVLVSDEVARHAGLEVGEQVPVQFSRGQVPLTVRAIYKQQNFVGLFGQSIPVLVAPSTIELGSGGTPQDTLVLVQTKSGESPATQRALREALAQDFPNIDVLTREQFRDDQQAQVDQFLTVLIAILTLSEIIAILGIINTLALSVFERTRELGLLRVVGMSRRQMRRMVRWESVVIAVLGGVVGLALGMLWGWAFARALEEQGITVFRIPWVEVLVFVGGSMLAGVLAAVFPAWRASRLDVLEAIATE
jgi:putative ABC transport system permease protein